MHFRSRILLLAASLLALPAVTSSAAQPARPWTPNPFTPLTPARIAELPAPERAVWEAYWNASDNLLQQLPARPRADASNLRPMSTPPKGGVHSKGLRFGQPTAWYASEEAQLIATHVVAAQMSIGAWPKGIDYSQAPDAHLSAGASPTFDNNATISELRFLARVLAAAPDDARASRWRESFERGLHYVFAAQYPNGGFPQVYPLIGGYHDGVTYNDDAMTQILELLRDVSAGKKEYAAVAPGLRAQAAEHLQRGIACVFATQLRDSEGRRTVWAQQYDPLTLRPAAARNFEPIADASRESAAITLLLMSLPERSPEIVAAVEGAIAWFRATALRDLKISRAPHDLRGEAVPSPGAPLLWARFYEPGTATPIFGDRDRTVHYDLAEVSSERIAGYAWYTQAPARALETYERWKNQN